MPSKSKQQQKFMGMAHALKKGEMKPSDASPELKKVAKSMSDKDVKDFASTSHKGLPRKVKQELLTKLKEYANKMGTNTMGGDDYTSSKKGGLRDNDGYDNVDYNKDMPMDESMMSTLDQIRKDSKSVKDFIKNVLLDRNFKDMKSDKDFIKYLGSIYEGNLPKNWMSGRVSDYHTSLRGKKKDYSGGTNFKKDNSGQPDLEESSPCWDGYKQVGMKTKGGKQVPNCVKESINEAPFHALNNPRFKKAASDLVKNKKIKNPETKKDVALTTALKDKDHPAHNQAKSLFKRLFGEYASNQTLSYLPADEEEIKQMNETMIRRAVDIAQELLPKDTWSRYTNDGQKNAEFVKNVVRDLTQSLNRFYKNHNISVRIKENEEDSNVDMVLGVLSILRQIDDKENRKRVAVDMIKKFKEQDIDFDYKEFLELMREYKK